MFTHYRPVGDPKWFEKENHEGVLDAVVEVEGGCRLEKVSTAETANKRLGFVEAVKCDDSRLGSYISPALFKAAGPEDLIDWWRTTAPKEAESTISSGRDEL